jgi:hypothetical protein
LVGRGATPEAVTRAWWDAVDRSDFVGAAQLCSESAVVEWPLSNERMATIDAWTKVNEHYPGTWRASVTGLVAQGEAVVTVVSVFDDTTAVTAISFFTIRDGLVQKLVEYWPDAYVAPAWRSQWIEPID